MLILKNSQRGVEKCNLTLFQSSFIILTIFKPHCRGKHPLQIIFVHLSSPLLPNIKSSPAGLVLEFEIWRLKAITDLTYL